MVIAFIAIVELQGAIGVRAMVGSLRAAGALNPIQIPVMGGTYLVGLAVSLWAIRCLWRSERLGAFLVVVCGAHGLVGQATSFAQLLQLRINHQVELDASWFLVGSVFGVGWAVCILVCLWGPGRQEFLLDATLRGRFLIRGGAIGTVWSLAATGVTAAATALAFRL